MIIFTSIVGFIIAHCALVCVILDILNWSLKQNSGENKSNMKIFDSRFTMCILGVTALIPIINVLTFLWVDREGNGVFSYFFKRFE